MYSYFLQGCKSFGGSSRLCILDLDFMYFPLQENLIENLLDENVFDQICLLCILVHLKMSGGK